MLDPRVQPFRELTCWRVGNVKHVDPVQNVREQQHEKDEQHTRNGMKQNKGTRLAM